MSLWSHFHFQIAIWLHKNGLTRVCVLILVHVSSCESLIRFIREVISCISASTPVMLLLMLTVGLLYRIRGVKQRSGWYCLIKNNIVSEKMEKSEQNWFSLQSDETLSATLSFMMYSGKVTLWVTAGPLPEMKAHYCCISLILTFKLIVAL